MGVGGKGQHKTDRRFQGCGEIGGRGVFVRVMTQSPAAPDKEHGRRAYPGHHRSIVSRSAENRRHLVLASGHRGAQQGSQARVTGHGGMALFDLPMPCQPALQSQLLAVSLPRRDYC